LSARPAQPADVVDPGEREFQVVAEGVYRLTLSLFGIVLEADRLRWDRHELHGELSVACKIPGAHTVDGFLSRASFNFSSLTARTTLAKFLDARSNAADFDWLGFLEDISQRILVAERSGSPAVSLRDIARPDPCDSELIIHGLHVPRRHPSILFGDGGSAKSYLALYLAGLLSTLEINVGFFDWELAGEDHRDRLERLFGQEMPEIIYARCDRPLTHETDRLRRIVQERKLDFAFFDSVAFACDGPPESAEIAGQYFRAVRQLGPIGSMHLAHIPKAEGGDQKPFGSAFWHNGARATFFAKRAEDLTPDAVVVSVAIHPRKANLGPLRRSVGVEFTFGEHDTKFSTFDLASVPDLARGLSLGPRIVVFLRSGARTRAEIGAEFSDQKPDTVKRTINRWLDAEHLTRLGGSGPGELIGLASRREQ
jgi:hypothetical protein